MNEGGSSMLYVGFSVLYGVSMVSLYLYMRRKSSGLELDDVNALLSDILEVNFRNNSLSNAAQSILIVLQRFYKADYVTILIMNERSEHLNIISSNVASAYLKNIELHSNSLLKTMTKAVSKVAIADKGVLGYKTARERNICFSSFTPLSFEGKIIGAILIENMEGKVLSDNASRMSLYTKIFKSTALVLQNVIRTEELISMTSTDQLTGVHNRRFIDMTLGEQLSIHRNLGMSLSLAIFDIDHFKKFNDTYGHPFGDVVLQEVAKYVDSQLSENDWVARYGGEEFVIFFGRSNASDVASRVDAIRRGLADLKIVHENEVVSVTASFGVASYPYIDGSANDLIQKADSALYTSKREGRNRVTLHKEKNIS